MSLQSAPLGQLPSMSMPYSIPRYEKPAGILEKALGALLVNAAGSAAQQGTENLFARDYATAEDGGPATGFSRLLGPKVGARQNEQRQQQTFQAGQQKSGQDFQSGELSRRLEAEQAQHEVDAMNAQAREQDRTQAGLDERYLGDMNAQARLERELSGRESDTRLRATLEAQDPYKVSETAKNTATSRKLDAETLMQQRMLDMLSHSGKGTQAPGGPQLSDADRAAMTTLRQGGATAQPRVDPGEFLEAMSDTPVGKVLGYASGITPAIEPASDIGSQFYGNGAIAELIRQFSELSTVPGRLFPSK